MIETAFSLEDSTHYYYYYTGGYVGGTLFVKKG